MKKLSWLDDEQKWRFVFQFIEAETSKTVLLVFKDRIRFAANPKKKGTDAHQRSSFAILLRSCLFVVFLRPPESHHSSIGKEITTEAMLNIVEQKRWRILQLWDARFMAWLSMWVCAFFCWKLWWILSKALRVLVVRFRCELFVSCVFETSKEHWPSVWYERWIPESCDLATSVRQTPWCNLRLLGTSHTWKPLRLNWKLALPAASVWFCTQIFATSHRKAQPVNVNSLKSYTYLSPVLAFSISRRVLD